MVQGIGNFRRFSLLMVAMGMAVAAASTNAQSIEPLSPKDAKAAAQLAKKSKPSNTPSAGLGSGEGTVAGIDTQRPCCLPDGTCMDLVFSSVCVNQLGGTPGFPNCELFDCRPSDECPGDLLESGDAAFGTTLAATVDENIPNCTGAPVGPGVWYRVIGDGTTLVASTCNPGSGFDTQLSVYCPDCEDAFCITGNDDDDCELLSRVEWCSEPGKEYLLLVHGFDGDAGNYHLSIGTEGECNMPSVVCNYCDQTYFASECTNEFEDISGTGALASNASECDDCSDEVSLNMSFEFFGVPRPLVNISSNGFLTFTTDVTDFTNDPIPSTIDPNDLIAPLWDDWDSSGVGRNVYYETRGTPGNRRFIVQWDNVAMFGAGDSNTFQAILFEATHCIEFRYGTVSSETASGDFTAGVEDPLGRTGTSLDTSGNLSGRCYRLCPGPCDEGSVLIDTDLTLLPAGLDLRQENDGPTITKAKFDIWNENERRFSGTERCVSCWDQSLLSRYGHPNHFRRETLHTDKARARIDGLESNVCPESTAAPMLAVAMKQIVLGTGRPQLSRSALVPQGSGIEAARIHYDRVAPTENAQTAAVSPPETGAFKVRAVERIASAASESSAIAAVGPSGERGSITAKGSVLYFPNVEVKWDPQRNLIQDTVLSLANDSPSPVRVQLYFVNGDEPLEERCIPECNRIPGQPCPVDCVSERAHSGWNWVDVELELTANQPIYWSAVTGNPAGVSPWDILDPGFPNGRPDPDVPFVGPVTTRVVRGFVVAWAINADGQPIRWNHLTGSALQIHYGDATAAEYEPWAFPCVSGSAEGDPCGAGLGELNLDGFEYAAPPDMLLMDYYTVGSQALTPRFR